MLKLFKNIKLNGAGSLDLDRITLLFHFHEKKHIKLFLIPE